MWPYVAVAAAASVHHASRAASSSARLPKTLGGGDGGGDGGGGEGDGGGGDGERYTTTAVTCECFITAPPLPPCRMHSSYMLALSVTLTLFVPSSTPPVVPTALPSPHAAPVATHQTSSPALIGWLPSKVSTLGSLW